MVLCLVEVLQVLDLDQVVFDYLAGLGEKPFRHSQDAQIQPFSPDELPSFRQDEGLSVLADYLEAGLFGKIGLVLLEEEFECVRVLIYVIKLNK